ncbi:hypothetical protein QNI16_37180 [Cytophagaceae bacterium YF14B1]|uniref:Uncharacterized protein n=1 Tax=Xanthocytophaga flava TaxID=3048013 RepID=A0AAE3QZQ2_9BACT|nr:hypothetical protein [Xanthocytophaga flavus]MDJ1486176.1 hypothetical protein [Xanthocytophaga flavus]
MANGLILHLHIIGSLLLLLAVVHLDFPRRFSWKIELSSLSLMNRQMIQVHTFFIALFVGLNGLLFLSMAEELLQPSPLARAITIGLLVFWGCRLVFQFLVYDSALWRGKRFETIMHIIFSLFWSYCLVIFILLFTIQIQ